MSAELVDPFATPPRHRPMTPDEWRDIHDEIYNGHWDDHQLYPDLITEAVKVLGEVALWMGEPAELSHIATQCLRRMAYRAKTGVPFNEPQEDPHV